MPTTRGEHTTGIAPERGLSASALLVALCPAAFVGVVGSLALSPFLPAIAAELDTSVALLGQVGSVMMLVAAALGLVVGPLADARGHRLVLLAGTLAVAASAVLIALAGSYPLLMLAAVVGAVSRAITLPLSYAVAGSRLRGEAARRALGRVAGAAGGAGGGGIPLLTAGAAPFGWRAAFVALALMGLAAAALVWRFLPSDTARAGRLDGPNVVARLRGSVAPLRDRGLLGVYGGIFSRSATSWLVVAYLGAFLALERGM